MTILCSCLSTLFLWRTYYDLPCLTHFAIAVDELCVLTMWHDIFFDLLYEKRQIMNFETNVNCSSIHATAKLTIKLYQKIFLHPSPTLNHYNHHPHHHQPSLQPSIFFHEWLNLLSNKRDTWKTSMIFTWESNLLNTYLYVCTNLWNNPFCWACFRNNCAGFT